MFSTMMSSSSFIMVYIAPCSKEVLPLVYEKSSVASRLLCNMNSFDYILTDFKDATLG